MAYSSITKPSLHFNTKLTTGTGSSQAVTGLGFQPDWIWGKRRDSSGHHSLFDSVRGITKGIEANQSGAEFTSTDYYSSFDSDGFTIAAGSSGAGNGSSQTAAQWCWKANGSGSSNGDGATASTVSVNSTAGFSIVSWTGTGSGTTIGHGLGAKPKIIFVKNRSSATNWVVNVGEIVGADERSLRLNSTNAIMNDAAQAGGYTYNNQATTFQTANGSNGNQNDVNESGSNIIAYCFAEKKGYSKFGSYTGNGNADGAFVYTGFKPAFVLTKSTSNAVNWQIQDNKTAPHNLMVNKLFANTNAAQDTGSENTVDFYSTGFKPRGTGSSENINGNGYSYIYMAFAAEPLVANVGNSIPATAR